ncbi:DUF4189 domain-containing protein [Nocardia altamirensis]|uniref:DUF4189 domain-containing protein n=1 Tax=Nocardia altamirensis TaxID=472158 RepID=UPI0008406266|nr:DUF4189 domain-containing protein [Nocardia altamirensis]
MNIKLAVAATFAVCAAAVCSAAPASAFPVNWGAISFSPASGRLGYATNFPSEDAAVQTAKANCTGAIHSAGSGNYAAGDCVTPVTFTEGCAAVAESNLIWVKVRIMGFGKGATPEEAERNAVADVNRVAPGTGSAGATIALRICNRPTD